MSKIVKKGGAIIGFLQIRTPLANININENSLAISASVVGTYSFKPKDVVSIRGRRFFFNRGISIKHINSAFPQRVIFIPSTGDLKPEDIKNIGFIPQANAADLKNIKNNLFTPTNLLAIIMVASIVFWFLLFLRG